MRNTPEPLDLCILIPCFNNVSGLISTLKSIKYHADRFLVLVVDDGSVERITTDVLTPHLDNPLPIKVINLNKNQGITQALNTGLRWIVNQHSVKYIARLDCADLCHTDRFYEQVDTLNAYPKIGLLGTWCVFRNPHTNFSYTYTTPETHKRILKEMHYRNVFIHPTVMFRSELVNKVGYYPDDYPHVEDYAFFWKIAENALTAVIPKVLVTCEINEKGISHKNRKAQLVGRYSVVSEFGINLFDKIMGQLKLRLLMATPYPYILKIKSLGK